MLARCAAQCRETGRWQFITRIILLAYCVFVRAM
jgi:hypothetical protein